ncbi:MAG: type II secretion system F family protein [Acidobacteria bacterium]|nr:type II secretion system F family protein [Acidobacteriota bacterium]MDW7985390.1 type II secretion system F family protein [Acidobacteriota bacterium]
MGRRGVAYWQIRVRISDLVGGPQDMAVVLIQGTQEEAYQRAIRVFGSQRVVGIQKVLSGFWRLRPGVRDRLMVLEMFRDFIAEGISPLRAISTRLPTFPLRIRRVLAPIAGAVAAGSGLGEALRFAGFPDREARLVEIGERSGQLVELLERTIELVQDTETLRQSLLTVAMYPALVVLVMGGVGWVYHLFVLKNIQQVMSEMGRDLPWASQALVVAMGWFPVVVGFATLGGLLWRRARTWLLRLPGLRSVAEMIDVMRTLWVIEAGLAASDPLDRSFEYAARLCLTERMAQAARSMARWARGEESGRVPMYERLLDVGYPMDMAVIMSTGYETGRLEETVRRLARRYQEKIREMARRLAQAVEYGLILVIGLLVGGSVASIYSTIYQTITRFGG